MYRDQLIQNSNKPKGDKLHQSLQRAEMGRLGSGRKYGSYRLIIGCLRSSCERKVEEYPRLLTTVGESCDVELRSGFGVGLGVGYRTGKGKAGVVVAWKNCVPRCGVRWQATVVVRVFRSLK